MSNNVTSAIQVERESELILSEQVKLLFGAMPLSIAATLVNGIILVVLQWSVVSQQSLITWLVFLLVVLMARVVLTYFYRRNEPRVEDSQRWANYFLLGVIAAAAVWGSASMMLFPHNDVGHQAFLAFVVAGMSAGASTSLSFLRAPVVIFQAGAVLPLTLHLFYSGTKFAWAMGTMTLLFFAIVTVSSLKIYHNTRQNITLRIEADAREKALRESEKKYQHIFNSSPLGIVHYDEHGVVTDFNHTFAELIGKNGDALTGLNLISDACNEGLQEAVRQSLAGVSSHFEGVSDDFTGRNKVDIRVFCGGIELVNGDGGGGVAIVVDISEDKRIENLKKEFVSTVSHELRTPLTAILGAVGLLRGRYPAEASDKSSKLINIAHSNTERLLTLINDILDIDKIESGSLEFEFQPLELSTLLKDAVDSNMPYAERYKVKLVLDEHAEGARISGDHTRMMQVLSNLLSNAIKFSPEQAVVTLGVERTSDGVRIYVSDQGKGIPEEFQQHIYARFSQADGSDTRRVGGTGLGLNITKTLVEKHHGEISFETSPQGTTFYVTLPLLD